MCSYILSIMWYETRNISLIFCCFLWLNHFRDYPSRLFLLMISVVFSQGWDSLRYLFFAQRSVFTDKFQHLYSWVMFHLEVVIWTFHLFTRQRELERFCGNLKSFLHCSWLLQNLLQLVVIYIETIDFLSRVLLWHFLGTNFSSWLTNLIIRETA